MEFWARGKGPNDLVLQHVSLAGQGYHRFAYSTNRMMSKEDIFIPPTLRFPNVQIRLVQLDLQCTDPARHQSLILS
jgi:hypothetical protein